MNNIDLLVTLTQHERDSNNVTIAFTMGLKAAERGHDVELILLSDAVHLASRGYADKIDIKHWGQSPVFACFKTLYSL